MKITIPETLKDITLSQYQKFKLKEEQLISLKETEDTLMLHKISIICNISIEDVMNIEMVDIWRISRIIDNIFRQEPELIESIVLGDIKFGWVPSLDDMKYGEWLDLNNNIGNWENMHIAMGVLYRPIVKEDGKGKYNVEKYEGDKYHYLIKDITMDAVIGAMVFFWNLGMDCVIAITSYLDDKEMKFQRQLSLLENGVGLQPSMNSLKEMLQSLKR